MPGCRKNSARSRPDTSAVTTASSSPPSAGVLVPPFEFLGFAVVVVAVAMRFGVVVVGRGGGVACSFCGGVACVARTSLGRPRRVGGTCLGSNNSGDAVLVPDAGAQ
eukprot:CAMPEP_0171743332 /NCGR_PEP_ID=MMETSP0991-20121206/36825_1 /TAXON_ID=483369 /ORGANISM="non described non described, Strain CCMP2098" /LENGTH=106 /DNA_ID=CAMNT_0012342239 /DNA_START=222 /DNA_END=542 /DNA_ORIENTATION=-